MEARWVSGASSEMIEGDILLKVKRSIEVLGTNS